MFWEPPGDGGQDGMLMVHWILHILSLSLGQEEVPSVHLEPGVF